MESETQPIDEMPTPLGVVPTAFPTSPPIEEMLDRFFDPGPEFATVEVDRSEPETHLEILEQLGASPFPRGDFPLIGFLASTYDRVSRYALDRD